MKTVRPLALALTSISVISLPASAQEKLDVVASFSILGDFASQVGGDRIALTTLVGPDSDAHVYQPKPADAATMTKADIVLTNGLGFEGFLERLTRSSEAKATVIEVSKGAALIEAEEDGHGHDEHGDGEKHAEQDDGQYHGATDPHAFQSVPNARVYVKTIAEAFCTADAAGCDTYKANAAAYDAKLDQLDKDIRAAIAAIPQGRRTIITSHDAFAYFGKEYGLTLLAPVGVSTEAEASAADIAALVRQIRDKKASAIFLENVANPKLMEQVAAETGIGIGGALYSDALSGPDGPASDYISLMRYNTATIADKAGS
jgi:zinc/manganese transport system substrate-binding protein